jgi:hypothetical protein
VVLVVWFSPVSIEKIRKRDRSRSSGEDKEERENVGPV